MGFVILAGAVTSQESLPVEPLPRSEIVVLAILCLGVLLYWAFQYQPFVLPNNDYHSFERAARSFASLEMPASFKRMPILPLFMAALAPLLPEPHGYLHAALIWNQVFSIGMLVGLYLIGRHCIGRAGLLLPILMATSTQFHGNGLQPLVEPSLGCFVVWAFWFQEKGSAWQYAAAFGAALSRYEAALIIPVLAAAELFSTRRFWSPFGKSLLAASGLLLWTAMGALQGSGGSSYYDLMSGMGFQPAPGFFIRSIKEPFTGWFTSSWIWMIPFVGVIAVPLVAGAVRAVRERPRLALSMLGFGVGCVVAIVVFGINKARYVYPTQWIWMLFWLQGAMWLGVWVAEEVERRFPTALRWLPGAGLALAVLALVFWVRKMSGVPQIAPLGVEFAFLALCLALCGWTLARMPRLLAAGLLVALVPLVAGGLVGKQRVVHKIFYANWSAHLVAEWLDENITAEDRVVLLPKSHIQHLIEIQRKQMRSYGEMESEDLEGLREEFASKGLTLAVFTDRGPLRNPSHHHYYKEKKTYLAELFESGGSVAGFEHVATLSLPDHIERKPVQIYRFREPAR